MKVGDLDAVWLVLLFGLPLLIIIGLGIAAVMYLPGLFRSSSVSRGAKVLVGLLVFFFFFGPLSGFLGAFFGR